MVQFRFPPHSLCSWYVLRVSPIYCNAGYTPQDNRADFWPISPLPTILGNVPIILVDLKIILSDFPVVWGVLRVTESARKNVGGASIANHKYSTCWIFTIRNPDVWGEPRGQTRVWSADYHVKRNNIQSESELTEDGNITNAVISQHKSIWTLSSQFLPAITKDWDFKALNLFFE